MQMTAIGQWGLECYLR